MLEVTSISYRPSLIQPTHSFSFFVSHLFLLFYWPTSAVPGMGPQPQTGVANARTRNPYLDSPAAIPGVSNPYVAIAAANPALASHPGFQQLMTNCGMPH